MVILLLLIEAVDVLEETPGHTEGHGNPEKAGLLPRRDVSRTGGESFRCFNR